MIYVERFYGSDDQKVAQALAAVRKSNPHRPVTLVFAERENAYVLSQPLVIPGNVSLVSEGRAKRSTVLAFHGDQIQSGDALVTWDRPFGCTFANIRIAASVDMSDRTGVVGLRSQGATSCTFRDFEVAMGSFGSDSIGLYLDRHESRTCDSTVVTDFNIQASTCIKGIVGDNIFISHFDLTCQNNHAHEVGAGIHQTIAAWNVVIREGTIQKGDYAYYNRTDANNPGNVLRLQDIRYEQGNDHGQAAWVMDVTRRYENTGRQWWGQETFIMDGCRNSKRQHSTEFLGARAQRIQCGGDDGYGDLGGLPIERHYDDKG